jgi:hypothetical protein
MTAAPPVFDPEDFVDVRLLRLPVDVYARTQEHGDELVREFELIAQGLKDEHRHAIPARLTALVEQLTMTYSGLNTAQELQLARAVEAGDAEIAELVFRIPRQAAEASRQLGELLDEADAYCAAGQHLLTLATPPEAKRFRDWYLGEFIRQIAGEPPTAWPDFTG